MVGTVLATRWLLGLALMAFPAGVQAQIGLGSGLAQVQLKATSPARAALHPSSPLPELVRLDADGGATVRLHLSANSAYRMVVHRTDDGSSSRLLVRAADGAYHELRAGSPVVVQRGSRARGDAENSVRFRWAKSADPTPAVLPVRYELVVDPTI
jgi:hypothetical protein